MVVPQHHPLQLANQLASLDRLSGGRLTLGAGVGWSKAEFEALDQDFHTRGRRMDEALELMRLAWTTDPTTYRGDFFTLEEFKIQPKPVGSIPIWIGGTSDAAIARAVGPTATREFRCRPTRWRRLSIACGRRAPATISS